MSAFCNTPTSSILAYGVAGLMAGAILPNISFYSGLIQGIATAILFYNTKSHLEKQLFRPLSDVEAAVVSWLSVTTCFTVLGTSLICLANDSWISSLVLSIFLFVFSRYSQPPLDEIASIIR